MKQRLKKTGRSVLCMMLVLCMLIGGITMVPSQTACAATGKVYKKTEIVSLKMKWAGTVYLKVIDTYEKSENGTETYKETNGVYVSKKKKGTYRKLPHCKSRWDVVPISQEKVAYTDNQYLYVFSLNDGRIKNKCKLPKKKYKTYSVDSAKVMFGYKTKTSEIIVLRGTYTGTTDTDAYGYRRPYLYFYDTKTKKMKRVSNKDMYSDGTLQYKNYFIPRSSGNSEVWQITETGVKKISNLPRRVYRFEDEIYSDLSETAWGFGKDLFQTGLYVTDKYIYYISVACEDGSKYLSTITNDQNVQFDIYRHNRKTGKEKKVGKVVTTKWIWFDWDSPAPNVRNVNAIKELTDKYCIYTPDGTNYYKYIYATKRNVKVKK